MTDKIYLIGNDDSLITVGESPFESEDIFQQLLATHPDLLAGDQMRPGASRRWLLVSREMGIPDSDQGASRWSLDHLYLDQDGIPTLVEVKRSSDTRIRREVVGQMLDYAANAIVYWPPNEVQHRFELRCEEEDLNPEEEIAKFLGDGDIGPGDFWERVKTNLQARKIRMLFVTEVMPRELKRIIEFLNEQMDPAEVLGLELRHHAGGGVRILVPTVVGRTETATTRKTSGIRESREWDRDSILSEIDKAKGPRIRGLLEQFLNSCEEIVDGFEFGKGLISGRCSPTIYRKERGKKFKYTLANLWVPGTSFGLDITWLQGGDVFRNEEAGQELKERILAVPGASLSKGGHWADLALDEDNVEERLAGVYRYIGWAAEKIRGFPVEEVIQP